jgi:hypothetical protein
LTLSLLQASLSGLGGSGGEQALTLVLPKYQEFAIGSFAAQDTWAAFSATPQ